MSKTNTGLVAYVKAKIGCYYWFGTFGQMASRSLYNAKKKQYPKYYTASDFAKQIANPKQVFDCSGLIKAYLWTSSIDDVTPKYNSKQDFGATAFYDHAKVKGKLPNNNMKIGTLVFKGDDKDKSHVGVFVGDNTVVEAKGHAYGVVSSAFSSGKWTHWAECNLIEYVEEAAPVPDPVPEPTPAPAPVPSPQPVPAPSNDYEGVWKVTAKDGLNMRTKPNKTIILTVPYGKEVTCDGSSDGDWLKVTYKGKTGYCYKKYLSKVSAADPSAVYHTVKKGDTLSALARKYGTTVQKIVDLNHIKNPNVIVIGQKLRIK